MIHMQIDCFILHEKRVPCMAYNKSMNNAQHACLKDLLLPATRNS